MTQGGRRSAGRNASRRARAGSGSTSSGRGGSGTEPIGYPMATSHAEMTGSPFRPGWTGSVSRRYTGVPSSAEDLGVAEPIEKGFDIATSGPGVDLVLVDDGPDQFLD